MSHFLQEIKTTDRPKTEEALFDLYVRATQDFCRFLEDQTGIKARALPEYQRSLVWDRFLRMTPEMRWYKYRNFEGYFDLCREIVARGGSLCDKAHSLKAFLAKYALSLPEASDVLEVIDEDTYVEVYDNQFTQVFRSADFMKVTSHGLMSLEACEWFDLFERSKDLTSDQVEVVGKIFDGSICVPMYKPLEDHSVKEVNSVSPRVSQAEIVLYAPLFGVDGSFHGILHVFRVKSVADLNFKLMTSS